MWPHRKAVMVRRRCNSWNPVDLRRHRNADDAASPILVCRRGRFVVRAVRTVGSQAGRLVNDKSCATSRNIKLGAAP